ncbi:MAG TPA: MBL fold metallo-hydrolase [Longimicrobiaceae bacterium]|nr:MBL fold metallo-hydrolase [Longimicrobiaceae bacterium]
MPLSGVRAAILALAAGALPIGSAPSQGPAGAGGVSVTFLANAGVLLSSGDDQVLIDGLYRRYEGYAVPPDSTRVALARARPPFDAVDLVLVTHRHGDHFHPAPVAAHLRANPRATFLGPGQVADSLRGRLPAGAMRGPRFMVRTAAPGTRRREAAGGIAVEVLGLPHVGRRHRSVGHLGYVVEIGGRRVLHVGDAELSEAALAPLRLDTARIDVALLPYWEVTSQEGRRVIRKWIRPRQVAAIHLPERGTARIEREVRAAWPGAAAFARPLDVRRW